MNLLSACLHPHITTTHTTNQQPHSQRNPPPYAILLLFSLYFCGIRRYFQQILIVSRSGRLASELSGNPLLYPIIVSDCPSLQQAVLSFQIIFLQNNLFIFNILSACLHPHTPTTHTTKQHSPISRDTHHRMPYCYYFHYIFVV